MDWQPTTEIGFIVLGILQVVQMWLDSRQYKKDITITSLQQRVKTLEAELKESKKNHHAEIQELKSMVKDLEKTVFEITKQKSHLEGQIEVLKDQQAVKKKLISGTNASLAV